MIEEAYVSFETAKLLKEKGFDEDIDLWYDKDGEGFFCRHYNIRSDWRVRHGEKVYECPTQQMAMRWLREVYKAHIINGAKVFDSASGEITGYAPHIWYKPKRNQGICCYWVDIPDFADTFDSYEEACEAAIKYCLKHLID